MAAPSLLNHGDAARTNDLILGPFCGDIRDHCDLGCESFTGKGQPGCGDSGSLCGCWGMTVGNPRSTARLPAY
jgi:hypothetical protein